MTRGGFNNMGWLEVVGTDCCQLSFDADHPTEAWDYGLTCCLERCGWMIRCCPSCETFAMQHASLQLPCGAGAVRFVEVEELGEKPVETRDGQRISHHVLCFLNMHT